MHIASIGIDKTTFHLVLLQTGQARGSPFPMD